MRMRLPKRRPAVTFTFAHSYPGASERIFTAHAGYYPDGRIGEAFVSLVDGQQKLVTVDAHDAAILLSVALQRGATLADLGRAMLRGENGRPHGFVGALIDALMALPAP